MIVQPVRPLAFSALAYFAVGTASAVITNPIAASGTQALLRFVALILGGVVFLAHVRHEVLVLRSAPRKAAARSALGAAFGALLLAVSMVLYNMVIRSRPLGSVALVLVFWPLFAGALGFLAGHVAARAVRWRQ